jgi:FlaA1/EpsC-like NDP-sugar epimerase
MKTTINKSILKLTGPVLALPRSVKRLVVLSVDLILCIISAWVAYYLRLGEFISFTDNSLWPVLASTIIALPIFIVFGLYRAIFRYSGWPALTAVARAISLYGLLYSFIFTVIGVPDVPRTIGIIQPILLFIFIGTSRAMARIWLGDQYQTILKRASRPKALIYGAGGAGRQLASAMSNSPEMQVVGFLDDDDRLHGQLLKGIPIYNPADIADIKLSLDISVMLLAMQNISRKRRNEILNNAQQEHISIRTLPSMGDLVHGRVNFSDIRELDIDDLLGRDPVKPNILLMAKNIYNQTVLVTGAGGSIGSQLCRQIIENQPAKLLLIEQNEFSLYKIHQELIEKSADNNVDIVPLIGSVQSNDRMQEIMSVWRPDTVYHAAAYKHVPLVEHNPAEGIRNNVFGTLNTALVSVNNDVKSFILISTDKAVKPTNIMGASKRLAEMVLQALAITSLTTNFSMVRFGNVLGSSGSVIPKFRNQIRDGGPITLTHREITRYFMTIPEAAQLVIQAGAMAKGGDVFVLDMGEPVKIMDLARRMVELSGLTIKDDQNTDGDIEISVVGLRPGEKLYEELLLSDNPEQTSHPRIMVAKEEFLEWSHLQSKLHELEAEIENNNIIAIRKILVALIPSYQPADEVVDWVYKEIHAHKMNEPL